MKLSGGCSCGQVRYEVDGDPIRVGICHCETCRKESGSAFSFFGIWPKENTTLSGELGCWKSRAGCRRVSHDGSDKIEIKLGTLERSPSALVLAYELWTVRREPWLAHQKRAEQHTRDRGSAEQS
ncbi:GFA family protein [Bosea lupini]|uniref:GFA family protein n=1 Tax=Bosea lupini TaxID=1036779 RepID=UPI000B81A8E7|nr:GFA family protein [Bosea lupini]